MNDNLNLSEIDNQQIIDSIVNAENGNLVKVGAAGTDYIRLQLREEGFFRKIIPPQTISNSDLDRSDKHEFPIVIEELEPGNGGAVSVPFNTSREAEYFYGPRGLTSFYQIKTPKFQKNINELRTARMDVQKVLTDNALKDIQTREDGDFIALVDEIVGDFNGVGGSGKQQHFKAGSGANGTVSALAGGITRHTYPEIKKFLEKLRLNNGVFLMNCSTAKEFEKWDRAEIGGDMAQEVFKNGLKGIGDSVIGGVPHIYTLKSELVPDNIIYGFTEPNFLGRFYILQDATMYVKKEEDMIEFGATETIGASVLNMRGVVKIDMDDTGSGS